MGESIGFWLNSENFGGHTPLHWVLRDRLRPVEDSGTSGAVVARGHERVRLINAGREVKLFLRPPELPGFYRYEIEIVDFEGKRLALYSSDFRVERRFWDIHLGLNRSTFHLGNHVFSRVENFGTLSPFYGYDFAIQRHTSTGWVHVRNPDRGWGWPAVGIYTAPGAVGPCSPLWLPRDFPVGHYRIVKAVERYLRQGRNRTYYLTAPFDVIQ